YWNKSIKHLICIHQRKRTVLNFWPLVKSLSEHNSSKCTYRYQSCLLSDLILEQVNKTLNLYSSTQTNCVKLLAFGEITFCIEFLQMSLAGLVLSCCLSALP